MAKVELINVGHQYSPGSEYAVKDINLTWEDGVASALLGPSGCGKTTLLKIISGLLQPSEGKILLDGKDVTADPPQLRNVAQVFQFPVVYETLSVFDNLAFPLRNRGVARARVRERVHEVAELLDLQPLLKARASRLGPAEKQRISLGRGIVRDDTTAVLLDEPLTVIDLHMKWHLRRKLKEMHQRLGLTMIYVTHDQHEALTFADQVTVMNMGEALQTGNPQALHDQPLAPFVGYFIGSPGMNIFDAQLCEAGVVIGEHLLLWPDLQQAQLSGKRLQLGIRPEYVQLQRHKPEASSPEAAQGDWLEAEVTTLTLNGSAMVVDVYSRGLHYKALVEENSSLRVGDRLWSLFPAASLMLYADGRAVLSSAQRASAHSQPTAAAAEEIA